MKKSIVAIIVLITGCGLVPEDPRTIKGIDPEFNYYVNMFESMYGGRINDVSMGFFDLEGNTIGFCTRWSTGHKQIKIDPSYWQFASEKEKIGLIFHELGHCVLYREHITETFYYSGSKIKGDVPKSLMYPNNFYSDYFSELENYYFAELFNVQTVYPTSLTKSKTNCVEDL